jgi:hypothetical protein
MKKRSRFLAFALLPLLTVSSLSFQQPQLTEQQMRDFLLNAKVTNTRETSKGLTGVLRLTLSDGTMTHDASFQSLDQTRTVMEYSDGRREFNFRDSYKYNVAAYELALLLGLGDMMPVTVLRKLSGKTGSLTWWLPVMMDEAQRLEKKIEPPVPDEWNKQMHKMRVFTQLVYDTDRNLGNVLISEDWHLWMIDFSRAFRLNKTLLNAKNLEKCDRQLLERMRLLDAKEVTAKTGEYLSRGEIEALMARRDQIIAVFEKFIKEKGEAAVLY